MRWGRGRIAQAKLEDAEKTLKARVRTMVRRTREEWQAKEREVGKWEEALEPEGSGEDELAAGE